MSRGAESLLFWTVAIVLSVTAWAFFHYLGPSSTTVLLIVLVVCLIAENRRLRRKQR